MHYVSYMRIFFCQVRKIPTNSNGLIRSSQSWRDSVLVLTLNCKLLKPVNSTWDPPVVLYTVTDKSLAHCNILLIYLELEREKELESEARDYYFFIHQVVFRFWRKWLEWYCSFSVFQDYWMNLNEKISLYTFSTILLQSQIIMTEALRRVTF